MGQPQTVEAHSAQPGARHERRFTSKARYAARRSRCHVVDSRTSAVSAMAMCAASPAAWRGTAFSPIGRWAGFSASGVASTKDTSERIWRARAFLTHPRDKPEHKAPCSRRGVMHGLFFFRRDQNRTEPRRVRPRSLAPLPARLTASMPTSTEAPPGSAVTMPHPTLQTDDPAPDRWYRTRGVPM